MPKRVEDIVPNEDKKHRPPEKDAETHSGKKKVKSTRGDIRKVASATKAHTKKPLPPEELPITITETHFESNKFDALYASRMPEGTKSMNEDKLSIRKMPFTPPLPPHRHGSHSKKWLMIGGIAILLIIICGYIASMYFARATFTIVPKTIDINANNTYVATASKGSSAFTYELITMTGTATSSIAATDGPVVNTKAQGKVNIYNSYSASSVRLIAGTRISSDDGKIYRLNSTVVIPGYTKNANGTVPGKVLAYVTADQPGQNYNISGTDNISDFKVVAYKGTPRYETIYARVASSFTGGYSGTQKIIAPSVVASTTADMKKTLSSALFAKMKLAVPVDYILYDNAYVSTFQAPVTDNSKPKVASLSLQGTVYGIMFRKTELTQKISNVDINTAFSNFAFTTKGIENLEVNIVNAKDFSPTKKSNIIVKIKGAVTVEPVIPVEEIRQKLAGVSLADTENILKPYGPIIKSGSGELVPPWSKVPKDTKKITVKVVND
jgi:hypothetical protein